MALTPAAAFRLDGRVAIVTGGAAGIGLETARWFAGAGARVVTFDRDEPAEAVAGVRGVRVDVTDRNAVAAAIADVAAREGRLDILVNNAGTGARKASVELDMADWDRVVRLNLDSAFLCAREAARVMLPRRSGAIVNVASIMGLVGNTLYPNAAYHATKGALVNLTRALAMEWAAAGVRVNAVAPTFVRTALTSRLLDDQAMAQGLLANTPLGRLAKPAEIAAGILYLVSDAAAMVTGHTLAIDGGWTAR